MAIKAAELSGYQPERVRELIRDGKTEIFFVSSRELASITVYP